MTFQRPAQDTLPLNGYGHVFDSFATIGDAEAHTRWRINSGLLELSSAAASTPAFPFAVDVSELTVGWGAKRGDGAVRLQFNRVPLDGAGDTPDSNNRFVLFIYWFLDDVFVNVFCCFICFVLFFAGVIS